MVEIPVDARARRRAAPSRARARRAKAKRCSLSRSRRWVASRRPSATSARGDAASRPRAPLASRSLFAAPFSRPSCGGGHRSSAARASRLAPRIACARRRRSWAVRAAPRCIGARPRPLLRATALDAFRPRRRPPPRPQLPAASRRRRGERARAGPRRLRALHPSPCRRRAPADWALKRFCREGVGAAASSAASTLATDVDVAAPPRRRDLRREGLAGAPSDAPAPAPRIRACAADDGSARDVSPADARAGRAERAISTSVRGRSCAATLRGARTRRAARVPGPLARAACATTLPQQPRALAACLLPRLRKRPVVAALSRLPRLIACVENERVGRSPSASVRPLPGARAPRRGRGASHPLDPRFLGAIGKGLHAYAYGLRVPTAALVIRVAVPRRPVRREPSRGVGNRASRPPRRARARFLGSVAADHALHVVRDHVIGARSARPAGGSTAANEPKECERARALRALSSRERSALQLSGQKNRREPHGPRIRAGLFPSYLRSPRAKRSAAPRRRSVRIARGQLDRARLSARGFATLARRVCGQRGG